MSQAILILDDEDLKKLYTLNLEALIGAEVICQSDAQSALNLLTILPEIPLVITQVQTTGEPTVEIIHDFIKHNNLSTSMIVVGKSPTHLQDEVTSLSNPYDVDELLSLVAPFMGFDEEFSFVRSFKRYIPVGLHYFYELPETPCDVYIKIREKEMGHYIKRMHARETIDRWDIERYKKLGLKEFYILNYDIKSFTITVSNEIVTKLENSEITFGEMIAANCFAHQVVKDTVQMSGLNGEAIELSEFSINKMVSSVLDTSNISDLLQELMSERITTSYKLCHLQSLICHYLLMKQSWYKLDHLATLSFVAYFHHITLTKDDLLLVKDNQDLRSKNLTPHEREQLLNLPLITLKVIEDHPGLTEKAKTILLECNGTKSGKGIADEPEENLNLLSKVFIVASAFVKIFLDPELPSTKIEILELLDGRFTEPAYQKIIRALEQRFS